MWSDAADWEDAEDVATATKLVNAEGVNLGAPFGDGPPHVNDELRAVVQFANGYYLQLRKAMEDKWEALKARHAADAEAGRA